MSIPAPNRARGYILRINELLDALPVRLLLDLWTSQREYHCPPRDITENS